jgi:hypothetical protein
MVNWNVDPTTCTAALVCEKRFQEVFDAVPAS